MTESANKIKTKRVKKVEDWPTYIKDNSEFILNNTQLKNPPLLPEMKLYLSEVFNALWRVTETRFEAKNIPPPFWSFAWPGGQALARYVLDNPEIVRGKRVFDFASGSGLCAIAAKMSGAASVVANDVDPLSIVAVGMNAQANGVDVDVLHDNKINRDLPDIDVILAGDFCYEWPMAGYAIEWLRAQIKQGKTVLLADPGRNYLPKEGLEKLAEYDIATPLEVEDSEIKHTTIYKLLVEEE